MKKSIRLKASFTVEMSVIAPVIMFIILMAVMAAFYEHDKNIISSAAYETAVVGSSLARKKEPVTSDTLQGLFRERVGKKCILMGNPTLKVTVTKEEIIASGSASFKKMKFSVVRKVPLTEPEEYIRKRRR